MSTELFPVDGRWACSNCSRFIAESKIRWWDERDDSTYYGVTTRYEVDCATCGLLSDADALPPYWRPTRWAPMEVGE